MHYGANDMPRYYDLAYKKNSPAETEDEIISRISGKLRDMGNERI